MLRLRQALLSIHLDHSIFGWSTKTWRSTQEDSSTRSIRYSVKNYRRLIRHRPSAIGTHTTILLRLSATITGRSGAAPTESSQYMSFGAPKFGQQHDTARLFAEPNDT